MIDPAKEKGFPMKGRFAVINGCLAISFYTLAG
jgi:hypothetical protein